MDGTDVQSKFLRTLPALAVPGTETVQNQEIRAPETTNAVKANTRVNLASTGHISSYCVKLVLCGGTREV